MLGDSPGNTALTNLYDGTECGRIKVATDELIGRRIIHEEHVATICYVGPLPQSKGIWLGVDWKNPNRGRHDGSYRGKRYFQASTLTSGSFVRPDKVSLGTSLEEALVFRYAVCAECQLLAQNSFSHNSQNQLSQAEGIFFQRDEQPGRLNAFFGGMPTPEEAEYSGGLPPFIQLFTTPAVPAAGAAANGGTDHQLCGAAGAKDALKRLKSSCLAMVPVFRALIYNKEDKDHSTAETTHLWPLPGGTLGDLLPNLVELDLSSCLLTKWVELAEACIQLPWLKVLNVSSNALRLPLGTTESVPPTLTGDEVCEWRLKRDIDSDPVASEHLLSRAFPGLCQLIFLRCPLLNWQHLCRIVLWMPKLRSLSVAYNQLGDPSPDWSDSVITCFRRLIELDLTNIGLSQLDVLFSVLGLSPVLDSLLLENNQLETWAHLPERVNNGETTNWWTVTSYFPSLTLLGLKRNLFKSWSCVNELSRLQKLHHLLFAECPLVADINTGTARQELIARIPKLTWLNRMEVTSEERRGAELDYLKRYGAVWRSDGGIEQEDDATKVVVSAEFHQQHPMFGKLCAKYGAPHINESKLFNHSLKEGLRNLRLFCEPASSGVAAALNEAGIMKRLPMRMTVAHLRMMARRLFRLPANAVIQLVAQCERHRTANLDVPLDADTREIGFYELEDDDTVFVRWQT